MVQYKRISNLTASPVRRMYESERISPELLPGERSTSGRPYVPNAGEGRVDRSSVRHGKSSSSDSGYESPPRYQSREALQHLSAPTSRTDQGGALAHLPDPHQGTPQLGQE